jgi:D-alanyl-lipoteichoic acid acyltransferase DltB (MBOAT superfamily)
MPIPTSALSPTSLSYLGLVLVVLAVYYLVAPRAQTVVLWAASLLLSAAWNPYFALVILASSLLNYGFALAIEGGSPARRRWLYAGIAANLLGLFVFKYLSPTAALTGQVLNRFGVGPGSIEFDILQPIGISFYTLQAISYLLDVYRRQVTANRSYIEVSVYLAYFPKLLAGPIERAGGFFSQLQQPRVLDNERLAGAVVKIVVGLVRKLVLADAVLRVIPLSRLSEPSSSTAPDLLFWWLVYAFVVYNDFAGYTSIARGVSELFAIDLSLNFSQPFFSTGYMDFWNRWHISLSHWLRDYIYLPLSRALLRRHPSGRYLPNLVVPPLVTMLLSGLWHGGAPHFVLWGLLNGTLQALERVYRSRIRATSTRPPRWRLVLSTAGTLVTLVLLSVPFLLGVPESLKFWAAMWDWSSPGGLTLAAAARPVLAILLSLGMDLAERPRGDETGWLQRGRSIQTAALAAALLLLFLATRQAAPAPFIYQEF